MRTNCLWLHEEYIRIWGSTILKDVFTSTPVDACSCKSNMRFRVERLGFKHQAVESVESL